MLFFLNTKKKKKRENFVSSKIEIPIFESGAGKKEKENVENLYLSPSLFLWYPFQRRILYKANSAPPNLEMVATANNHCKQITFKRSPVKRFPVGLSFISTSSTKDSLSAIRRGGWNQIANQRKNATRKPANLYHTTT